MFNILPFALRTLLASYILTNEPSPDSSPLVFQLRHEHGISNDSRIVFSDIAQSNGFITEEFAVRTRSVKAHRPSSFASYSRARVRSMTQWQSQALLWDETDVPGPDVKHRESILTLAKMVNNAYYKGVESSWYDPGPAWNNSYPFGWEPDADGIRGQIFVSNDNSTVIISIKGTSANWLVGGGGPTVKRDKLNDNRLFSCCCARVGPTWSTVCDCYSGGYKCDQTCVQESLQEDTLFYHIGTNLYNNVTYLYPDANIWIVGHSLGGALASLLGVTFGAPVVTFEAPGEKLAASRLHLPSPPSTQHVTHVYHTADPVPMGTCNGVTSTCAIGGYAFESRCHLGKSVRYDTVTKRGWSVDIRNHGIKFIIDNLLSEDWEPPLAENGEGKQVPALENEERDCVDCFNWEFGDFKNPPTTGNITG